MFLHIGKLLGQGYILLLTLAAGGLVGANIAGFLALGFEVVSTGAEPDALAVQSWMHGGWIAGATLFLSGLIAKWVHSRGKESEVKTKKPPRRGRCISQQKPFRVTIDGRPCGVLGALGVGTFGGALLGSLLGGTLLLFWFSIAYSSFAPEGWNSSISVENVGVERSGNQALTTNHPIALYAFFGPVIGGAVLLGTVCGVMTAIEKLRSWRETSATERTAPQ